MRAAPPLNVDRNGFDAEEGFDASFDVDRMLAVGQAFEDDPILAVSAAGHDVELAAGFAAARVQPGRAQSSQRWIGTTTESRASQWPPPGFHSHS